MSYICYGGTIKNENNVLSCEKPIDTYAFLSDEVPNGYSFSAKIKLKKEGKAGLYFHTIHKNGIEWYVGYALIVDATDHSITLYKVSNGDHIVSILGQVKSPFDLDTWYDIKVEQEGKNTRLYFNNFGSGKLNGESLKRTPRFI